jgi:hypothetical protein
VSELHYFAVGALSPKLDGADSQKRHALCRKNSEGRVTFARSSSQALGISALLAARAVRAI